jgi:transcriptional regulator with XRE-family HTH domain
MASDLRRALRDFGDRKGWTQRDMAEKIGVSHKAYAAYEQGNSEPSMETLKRLGALGFNSELVVLFNIGPDVPAIVTEAKPEYGPSTDRVIGRLEGKVEALEKECQFFREEIRQVLNECAEGQRNGKKNNTPISSGVH